MSEAFEPKYTAELGSPYPVADEAALAAAETEAKSLLERPTSRRAILGVGGVLILNKMIGIIEEPLLDAHYGTHDMRITMPGGCDTAQPLTHASLTSPGFGSNKGRKIVDGLVEAGVYKKTFPNAYFEFAGSIAERSIGVCAQKFARRLKPKTIDAHGVSEGGIIVTTAALEAELPLAMVTTNDSPFDVDDAYHAWAVKTIARAHEFGLYDGGIGGKYLTYLVQEVEANGFKDIGDRLDDVWDKTSDGINPRSMMDQAVLLAQTDLRKRIPDFKRRGVINSDTRPIIIRTEQAIYDKVVIADRSSDNWKDFWAAFGIEAQEVFVPSRGHALIRAGIKASRDHMRQIVAERY